MANNGRVFVSHSHDDNTRCAPLLTALDAWGVDYFFDTQGLTAGQQLNARIQRELNERDVMLRVCTATTQTSFWMSLEASAFRGLQAEDQRKGRSGRMLISIILDPQHAPDVFDAATLFIDAANRPRSQWLADLGRALGVLGGTTVRTMSRRQILTLGAASLVAAGSVAGAGAVYETYHPVTPDAPIVGRTALPGGQLWHMPNLSSRSHIPPAPSTSGSVLYSMTLTGLTAFDLSGESSSPPKSLWTHAFHPTHEYSTAIQHGDTVYVTIDTELTALHASNGQTIWSISAPTDNGSLASTPAWSNGKLFLLDDDGTAHAFNAKDGAHLWRVPLNSLGTVNDPTKTRSTPDFDATSVYIGSDDHHVYALSQRDGSVRWKFLTRGAVNSSPVVSDGIAYVGSSDYYVYALDTRNGAVKWKYRTANAVNSTAAVKDGVVYIASDDSYLYALDAQTGAPFWRSPVGDIDDNTGTIQNSGPIITPTVVTGDAVVTMDVFNWTVRAFSRSNGESRWTYKSKDSNQNANPIGSHGVVYFGSGDGGMYAFDA